ncbi:hypothetical protein PF003_g36284 [Phytophthora fragariae]|nr:hypothetical protein PF003_g36284 [Phytophthora fragariae]
MWMSMAGSENSTVVVSSWYHLVTSHTSDLPSALWSAVSNATSA